MSQNKTFSYVIENIECDDIDGSIEIHKVVTLIINKNNFNIKIIPETYIINEYSVNFIEISTYHYTIACGVFNLNADIYKLKMEFHGSGDGEGCDMYIDCDISKNDFINFKKIVNLINKEIDK